MKDVKWGTFIFALVLPLLVGGISASLSMQGMADYNSMSKPPLSPPAWVFPVAWTILYLMMGLASYFIFVSQERLAARLTAILFYVIQLIMNFMWSIIFFRWDMYLTAFIWLMILWCMVIICAISFYRVRKRSGLLLVPYILWLTFAAYLNLGAHLLRA